MGRIIALRKRRACAVLNLVLFAVESASGQPFSWETATPESQGMASDKLDALRHILAERATNAFLVIHNDKIVYEWYADGHPAEEKRGTASLAKALVGGMSLGVALTDGKIALDDLASKFVPQWKEDAEKSKITIRQLGSHTSGLSDSTTAGVPHEQQPGWKGDFWKRLEPPRDPFTIARDKTPVMYPVGKRLEYSNPGIGMLTYCVAAALRESQPNDIRTLLRDRIMRPIGVTDDEWSCGYGQMFTVDGLPLVAAWGGGAFTPRAAARVGRLLIHDGQWDGQQLLSREAVRQITGDAGLDGHCGMGFWTNGDGRYAKLPRDTYYGAGAGDQLLIVIPSLKLIVVRNGQELAPEPKDAKDVRAAFHDERVKILFEPLVDAIVHEPAPTNESQNAPCPPSALITHVEWAPPATVVRRAEGSDNWPMTWGDDDWIYTAYGDGRGFQSAAPHKLSLGLARIEGGPQDFRGVNLPSPTMELKGDGRLGLKASGMLMVDGVLYLWARNADNSQLAWSKDRGQSWQWADWKFTTSFGCPTFLNFGRNYGGARDDFVYVYSQDADSAYDVADRLVLARVPRDRILERGAYEFLRSVGANGDATWTRHMEDRGAAFVHEGVCYRSSVVYHPGLKRYLLVQTMPLTPGATDLRFAGGLGIYDAPTPWGPWTTVYFTRRWDIGPGESAHLPTKWFGADGRTLAIVFSGNDCFSVRRATLSLAPTAFKDSYESSGADE